MIKIKQKNYNIVFMLSLVLIDLYIYLHSHLPSYFTVIIKLGIGICIIVLFSISLLRISTIHIISIKKLIIVFILLFVISIGIIFKNTDLVGIGVISLLSLSLNDKDLIRMYLYALAVIFIINYFLSFIKILPNFDLFGFGNKNAAGYFLCCFSFAILFILKKHKILKNILIGITTFFMWFILNDRTIAIALCVFLILFNTKSLFNKVIFKRSLIILPIILTILSFYLAFKFKNDSYIINLINDILSNRVAIWNNIIQNYNVILLPQYIRSTAYIWTITTQNILSLISYQGLDGFFIMSNYMYGIIIGGVYLIALTYMLYLLLKEPIRNHLILCLSVCWIFIGFSETVVGYYYMSFLLPLAFNVIANSNVRDKNV